MVAVQTMIEQENTRDIKLYISLYCGKPKDIIEHTPFGMLTSSLSRRVHGSQISSKSIH